MKKSIILICIAFTSCKTLYISDLKPANKNSNTLQTLEPLVDIRSLASAYSLGTTSSYGNAYTTPIFGTYITTGSSSSTSYADIRIQDAIVLFDREVKDNIANSLGEKYGYVTFKITTGGGRVSDGLSYVSGLMLGIPNLFGMSFGNAKTSLEIEVEVLDSKKNAIGRYSAIGYAKEPIAMWRGYNQQTALRKSNIEAIKMAMTAIKNKINSEYKTLNKKLLESGTLGQK